MNRRNKLKGIAQEKIMKDILGLNFNDKSIQEYLKNEIKIKNLNYYKVKKNFEYNYKKYNKYDVISEKEYQLIDKEIIIEEDYNKPNKHRECSNCGMKQYNYYDENGKKDKTGYYGKNGFKKFTSKCFNCKKAYFQTTYKLTKKHININKEDIINKLNLNKRIDGIYYKNNKLILLESKNKEISGFSYADIIKTVPYIHILSLAKNKLKEINKVDFIYNGEINDNLEKITNFFEGKYDIKINYIKVTDIIDYNKLNGHCLSVYYKNNKYEYKYTYEPILLSEENKFGINLNLNNWEKVILNANY
mgnify:CR=1 FL=1|jgi:hypothetical protein|tara:strand:+ start:1018 stop:1929 length:912 start_codon:yes stop_codon:yes gene_type:complete